MNKVRPLVLMELRHSEIYGIGVFAVRNIRKGRKIADGLAEKDFGTLISWSEFDEFDSQTRKEIWISTNFRLNGISITRAMGT
jgi:hypothetical protein